MDDFLLIHSYIRKTNTANDRVHNPDMHAMPLLSESHPRRLRHAARRAPMRTQRMSEHHTLAASRTAMRQLLNGKTARPKQQPQELF